MQGSTWLERYDVEEGPRHTTLSRLVQTMVALEAPQDLFLTVSKSVAPYCQSKSAEENHQWDRVSLDSQRLMITLEDLCLVSGDLWKIKGTIKFQKQFRTLREPYVNDYGLEIFKVGTKVVIYHHTIGNTGWIGPDLGADEQINLHYANRSTTTMVYFDDPLQGLIYKVCSDKKIALNP